MPCMAQEAGSVNTAVSAGSPSTENTWPWSTATYSAKKPGCVLPSPLQVRAEDEPARQAVVAVSAVDVRVDGDLLAEPEPGDTDTELVDDADDLVAGDEGEHGVEAAVVDVQVGAAHPDLGHLDPHLAGPASGRGIRRR